MTTLLALLLTLIIAHSSQFLLPRTLWPALFSVRPLLQQSVAISSLYLIILLLTRRPMLSMQLTLSVLVVFLVVNHAKFQALREPLVFSDVYLYIQVVRHPRLFLPFLNIPLTVTAIIVGLALLYLAISLEPALPATIAFYAGSAGLLLLCLLMSRKLALAASLIFEPIADIQQQGFFNSLLNYALQAESNPHKQALKQAIINHSPFAAPRRVQALPTKQPTIITIQSESFFDVRRLYPGINEQVLQHYQQLKNEALLKGTLNVPAWGANTLRPEFAFLSGIDNTHLKHYRFNPYQYLQDAPTPTLASHLKSLGYYCIALHPNCSTFFGRDKVFPLFGFDEFIDSEDFDPTATSGPYISDQAVGQKIIDIIERQTWQQPLFIFVITMENHGPLHLESAGEHDIENYYVSEPPKQHNDLTVYLRHLSNADNMLKTLSDYLRDQPEESLLCLYGDHVPSMPEVYNELDFNDGRTDYLIWHNQRHSEPDCSDQTGPTSALSAHQLAVKLLSVPERDDG